MRKILLPESFVRFTIICSDGTGGSDNLIDQSIIDDIFREFLAKTNNPFCKFRRSCFEIPVGICALGHVLCLVFVFRVLCFSNAH